jgi:hypothetical protein
MSSQQRVPTGNYSVAFNAVGSANNYENVDEYPSTNDSDYNWSNTDNVFDIFTFDAFTVPAGSTITNVKIYLRGKILPDGYNGDLGAIIEIYDPTYGYVCCDLFGNWTSSFVEQVMTWTTNPRSGSAWTVDQVNGVGNYRLCNFGYRTSTPDDNYADYVSRVYIEVNYTGPITLTVTDLAHADSLGAVALTQVHNLAVANMAHANSIDNVVLSQIHQLAVQALSHAHSLDSPTLTQIHQLIVQAMNHSHSLNGVTLSQIHNLVVQGLAHIHGIDNIALSPILVVQVLVHGHSMGSVSLSQIHNLIVQAAQHGHTLRGGWVFNLIEKAKPIPDEFQYQLLNVITATLPEGDFAYGRPSLKDPDLGPEGDFIYKKVK